MKFNILSYSDNAVKVKGIRNVFVPDDEDKRVIIEYLQAKYGEGSCNISDKTYRSDYIKTTPRIVFYAQSDTLADSVSTILNSVKDENFTVFIPKRSDEGAGRFFRSQNIPFQKYSFKQLKSFRPDALILLNDWSKEARRIIAHCRFLKIPTICVQESIIDFGDHFRRMQHADYVFLQGIHSILELNHPQCFITGNPRYENTLKENTDLKENYTLINSNFTYGIYEDIREQWLADIVHVLEDATEEYIISQHPRDFGNLDQFNHVIKSSSSSIADCLKNSKLLITRFSSLIHEALILGKPVIYYNPHDEHMQYDFEFNREFLFLARNKQELKEIVHLILRTNFNKQEVLNYLTVHCLPSHSIPSENILKIIREHNLIPKKYRFKDFIITFLFLGIFVKFYDKLLKLLNIR